jgi:hypothetical protein
MKKTKVLVVTEKFDPHADLVIPEIKRQGGQPIRLHMAHIPDEFNLVLHYDRRNGQKKVKIYKFDAHLEEIKSVWWRRPDALDIKAKMTADQKKFAKMEWQHSLRGVWSLLNCFWVSHPFHIRGIC